MSAWRGKVIDNGARSMRNESCVYLAFGSRCEVDGWIWGKQVRA